MIKTLKKRFTKELFYPGFLKLLFSYILPKNNDLYLDNIILTQKIENV
ncbi:hypothetical protein ES705_22175 [subsurface metagenome]